MRITFVLLVCTLSSFLLLNPALAQTSLNQPLSQGFYGLDNQMVSGEKTYSISLPENASWLFVGILTREGVLNLEVKNSSNYVYPGSGGSVVVENAQQGVYTVTITGTGKYVIFWDYLSSLRVQDCRSAGGICTPNVCNTYNSCNPLPATCTAGYCCSATCTLVLPADSEVLPWTWGNDGQLHVIYGLSGEKKTYIFRVPPGTEIAGGNFYAYDPATVFTFTFTSVPGYKWRGYDTYTGTMRYSGDAGFDFTPETMTPTPTDGFVPPGDYMVEILWTSPPYRPYGCLGCQGRILITAQKLPR